MAFFHFPKPLASEIEELDHEPPGARAHLDHSEEQVDSARNQRASSEPMDPGLTAVQGDVYDILGQLFNVLLQEIESFISFGEKLDS